MKTYDATVVLGSQPDYRNWQFPSHTYKSLDRAIELLKQKIAQYIALSGNYALKFDYSNIKQPFRESDRQEQYLLSRGVPPEAILKEGESKDTLANLYYLKKLVFRPHNIKKILFVTTDFRVKRISFLCQKVLGPDYMVDFETVDYAKDEVYKHEAHTLKKQQEFLADMKDGDNSWLDGKFYDAPMYKYWKDHDLKEEDPVKRIFI